MWDKCGISQKSPYLPTTPLSPPAGHQETPVPKAPHLPPDLGIVRFGVCIQGLNPPKFIVILRAGISFQMKKNTNIQKYLLMNLAVHTSTSLDTATRNSLLLHHASFFWIASGRNSDECTILELTCPIRTVGMLAWLFALIVASHCYQCHWVQ